MSSALHGFTGRRPIQNVIYQLYNWHQSFLWWRILEIRPNAFLKYTDKFDDPNLLGQMITTIELRKVLCGTELIATQEGIPDAIPTEMCYLGWQESLEKLKRLVEPNIPDS
jgi:uncharacterized protein YndB with AHSA1/START domain